MILFSLSSSLSYFLVLAPTSHKEVGVRPGESAPAKPRNPSGLYVSALPIATQLLPVTEQQTTKKPRTMRDEGRKEEKKKVEEYLSSRAAPVESVTMSMVAYDCVTPSEFASAGSVPNYESQCTSIFPIYATITSIIYYFLLPFPLSLFLLPLSVCRLPVCSKNITCR